MNRSKPKSTPPPSLLHEHMGGEYITSRFLGNLGRLESLRHEGREVYVPRAVAEEIAEKPDAAAQTVQNACTTWMQMRNVTDETAVTLVQAALHKGKLRPLSWRQNCTRKDWLWTIRMRGDSLTAVASKSLVPWEFYWLRNSEEPFGGLSSNSLPPRLRQFNRSRPFRR
jgi:hypothetical protein